MSCGAGVPNVWVTAHYRAAASRAFAVPLTQVLIAPLKWIMGVRVHACMCACIHPTQNHPFFPSSPPLQAASLERLENSVLESHVRCKFHMWNLIICYSLQYAQESSELTVSTCLELNKGQQHSWTVGFNLICLWLHRDSRLIPLFTPHPGFTIFTICEYWLVFVIKQIECNSYTF